MIRGKSTEFIFGMPCHYVNLQSVLIEFWQENYNGLPHGHTLPIIKTLDQCNPKSNPKQISIVLSAEETLRFADNRKAYVRFFGVKQNGQKFGGNKEEFSVYPVPKEQIYLLSFDGYTLKDSNGLCLNSVPLSEEYMLPTPNYNEWNYIDWDDEQEFGDHKEELPVDKTFDMPIRLLSSDGYVLKDSHGWYVATTAPIYLLSFDNYMLKDSNRLCLISVPIQGHNEWNYIYWHEGSDDYVR